MGEEPCWGWGYVGACGAVARARGRHPHRARARAPAHARTPTSRARPPQRWRLEAEGARGREAELRADGARLRGLLLEHAHAAAHAAAARAAWRAGSVGPEGGDWLFTLPLDSRGADLADAAAGGARGRGNDAAPPPSSEALSFSDGLPCHTPARGSIVFKTSIACGRASGGGRGGGAPRGFVPPGGGGGGRGGGGGGGGANLGRRVGGGFRRRHAFRRRN
jgi:hypothetical protein